LRKRRTAEHRQQGSNYHPLTHGTPPSWSLFLEGL
jgi:hypothetical protein